nr:hypothetical protein [Tanacetum cinerariifolium]
ELAEYINTPGWNRPAFYNNGDDDDEDCTIAITPDFLITDSLITGDEHLDTILEKESEEFIKSSVEDLVSNPSAHIGHNCPPKVSVISNPKPCKNQTIDELPQTLPSFHPTCYSGDESPFTCDSTPNIVDDFPNVFNPPSQPPKYSYEFCGSDAYYGHDCPPQVLFTYDLKPFTPKEPDNSLSMGDEHLDNIPARESDEFIKTSVKNLVPNPSESKGEHKCDVPACDDFQLSLIFSLMLTTISPLNPLFDEAIISIKIDPHHFSVESDLIESLLNHDSSIISLSSEIDSFLDEFVGELTLLKSISPGINETDCYPDEEIRLIKKLLYDNSSPRPSEEFISENSDDAIKSFSPSPILVEDNDYFMEEIDFSFTLDDPMPPGIEEDDYDSERDILIFEELLRNDSLSLSENESFHFDIPSSSHPSSKPPDGNSGILNVKVMGDISEHNVPMPRLMLTQPTLVLNQKKSPNLLSHQGHKTSQPSTECPMIFYERNTHILDVPFLHFYPPLDQLKYEENWVKLSDPKQALRGRHPMLILSF